MRRRTLLGAAAAMPATGLLRSRPARAQVRTIRLVEAGGRSGESVQAGYIDPFTRRTGIEVERLSPNPLGRLKAIVDDGSGDIVLYELPGGSMHAAVKLGLVEPIDWARVDPGPMFSEARHEFGFGHQFFSTVMSWRRAVRPLASWAEFFNPRDFPGPRAIPEYPNLALPFALLGAGVRPDNLYPLDVDAAIGKLSEIKDSVVLWWKSGESPPEMLRRGRVDYAIAWSGRIAGEPLIDFTFTGGMLNLSYFCIVKGSDADHQRAAWQFLHEASLAENQARAAAVISYTGPSPDLEPLLPRDRLAQYPTIRANKDVQWFQNGDWWEENGAAVADKWERFLDSL
jgi:putative spermidine/putrescine transport system substrate-binding protein